jgi:iron(III) transport system permease protein
MTNGAGAMITLRRRSGLLGSPRTMTGAPVGATVRWAIAAVTAVMVLAPALPILLQAFIDRPLYEDGWSPTLANVTDLATRGDIVGVGLTTAGFALLATLIAQVIGVAASVVVGRTDLPGRRLLGDVMLWPLYLSHLVLAVGWVAIYGPSGFATLGLGGLLGGVPWNLYTVGGMAVVAGICQAPLAYLYGLYGVARSIDPALEDAGRTIGAGPWTVLRRITLPLMLPSIIASTALNLVVAVEMLAIPLMLGEPSKIVTLSTFLYEEGLGATQPRHGMVAASAILLALLVGATLVLQRLLVGSGQRFETIRGKGTAPRRLALGPWRWPAAMVLGLYLLLAVIVPILGVMVRSFVSYLTPLIAPWKMATLSNYDRIWSEPAFVRAIVNTIEIGLVAAAIGTALAAAIAIVIQRSTFRFPRTLEALAYLPRIVPGLVAGLGVFYAAAILPPMGWLRGGLGILVLAYVMTTIPLGVGILQPALLQIGRDLDAAARTVGASWLSATTRVVVPLLKPALVGCFVLLFVVHLKTYVTAIFLYMPGQEIIGTTMLFLWEQGDAGVTAAFATIQIVLTAVILVVIRRVAGVRLYD